MSYTFPKYIVIEDPLNGGYRIIIGKCNFHKQLHDDISKIRGGGWYTFDHEKKSILLYNESSDFSFPDIEHIKIAVKNNMVGEKHRISKFSDFEIKFCSFSDISYAKENSVTIEK